jgi:hypothetical protein
MPSLVESKSVGQYTVRVAYLGPNTGYSIRVFKVGYFKPCKSTHLHDKEKALKQMEAYLAEFSRETAVTEPCAFGIPIKDWQENIKTLSDMDLLLFSRAFKALQAWKLWVNHVRPAPLILEAMLANEKRFREESQDTLF